MQRPSRRIRIGLFTSTISVLGLLLGSVALASPVSSNNSGVAWQILPTTLLPPLPTTLLPPLPTTLLPPLPTTLLPLPTTLPPLPTTLPPLPTTLPPLITTTTSIAVTTTTLPITTTTQQATTTTGASGTTTQPAGSVTTPGTAPQAPTSSTFATTTTSSLASGGATGGPSSGAGSGTSSNPSDVDFTGTFLALGPTVDDGDRFFDFDRTPIIDRIDTAALALGWLFDRDPSGLATVAFSPFLALLTIWDAIRSAGSGLVAPSAGLAAVVIGAIADRKSLLLRFRRTRGITRSTG